MITRGVLGSPDGRKRRYDAAPGSSSGTSMMSTPRHPGAPLDGLL
jgi:hypothetical protein